MNALHAVSAMRALNVVHALTEIPPFLFKVAKLVSEGQVVILDIMLHATEIPLLEQVR
jgi:predicted ester cyclase